MDSPHEIRVLREINTPVNKTKCLDDEFVTPKGGTPKEDRTPSHVYRTPIGGQTTPSKYASFRSSTIKKPRNLYQAVIPEHREALQQGMAVFVRDAAEGWIPGFIDQVMSSHLVVNASNKQRELKACDVALQPKGIDYIETEDLTKLSPLSTPAVLHSLKKRYSQDKIYTRAGETLVAINPFKVIPRLYDDDRIEEYHGHSACTEDTRPKPHVYEVAETAYRTMRLSVKENHNQSIIVSGESGAGKTESACYLMKYLVTVSGKSSQTRDVAKQIEQRILHSNPILEAFGNASTLRNHNSSRFGKFIQLHFDKNYQLEGASIRTYLLEKTRVVHQVDGECTFHIFYQILAGLDPSNRESLNMQNIQLLGSERRNKETDRRQYLKTVEALYNLGLHARELGAMIQILCALIHLMQVEIEADKEDDGVCVIAEKSRDALEKAAKILALSADDLEKVLLYRRITATHKRRMSVFSKPCTLAEAQSRRNCFMTLIYSSLFDWIVDKINSCTVCDSPFSNIGILDIYGFESFEDNSLEQLCINYANEKLQQHFVAHFLRDLQADYEREAVNWEVTDFTDNRPCLDLLEMNPGIFALINEECYLNRPSCSESLNERILMTLNTNSHISAGRRNLKSPQFIIQHYAAPVSYSVDNLVEKNKDNVPTEVMELIQHASHVSQSVLITNNEPEQPGKKKKTVLIKFKNSLDNLMTTLEGTQAHYIRCIKPNPSSVPGDFKTNFVLQQLEANGVVEAVDICRKGYPTRIVYEEFQKQFGIILRCEEQLSGGSNDKENTMLDNIDALYQKQLRMTPRRLSCTPKSKLRRRAGLSSGDHSRKLCASILRNVFGSQITDWSKTCGQFGRTKIFLKHGQLEKLETVKLQLLSKFAFTIQCAWRRFLQKKQQRQLAALLCIQSAVRGWLVRHDLKQKEQAATVVQRAFRRHRCRKAEKEEQEVEHVITLTPSRVSHQDDAGLCADLMSEAMKAGFSPTPTKPSQGDLEDSFVVCTETTTDSVVYHIIPSPSPAKASPRCQSPAVTPVNKRIQSRLRNSPNTPEYPQTPRVSKLAAPSFSPTASPSSCRSPSSSSFWPTLQFSTPRTYKAAFHSVAAAVAAAFLTKRKFHLAGAFNGIPYFEAKDGILSRRRMPKVHIRFHTRPNPLLRCGHYISQQEFQCSLADCLND